MLRKMCNTKPEADFQTKCKPLDSTPLPTLQQPLLMCASQVPLFQKQMRKKTLLLLK